MSSESSKSNQNINDSTNIPRGLIGRGGQIVTQGTRLPSIKMARDLTLGGVAKRTFKPSFAAAQKPKTEVQTQSTTPGSANLKRNSGRNKSHSRGGNSRGRGRGRGRGQQLTQLSGGLFSEGAPVLIAKKQTSCETKNSVTLVKNRFADNEKTFKTDAEQEQYNEEQYKLVMSDDFVDDGELESDVDMPTKLPLLYFDYEDKNMLLKKEVEPKEDNKLKIKTEVDLISSFNDVRIKAEPMDTPEFSRPDVNESIETETRDEALSADTLKTADVLKNLCRLGKDELILLRVPDEFTSLVTIKDDTPVIRQEPGLGLATGPPANNSNLPQQEKKKEPTKLNLPEGSLGKLQIMKSGKTQLLIGNTRLHIELGGPFEFLQDLTSVQTAGNQQALALLGRVRHSLICTPEFDQYLMNGDTI